MFCNNCGWDCRLFVVSKDAFDSAVTVESGSRECVRAWLFRLDEGLSSWGIENSRRTKGYESSQLQLLLTSRKCKQWSKAGEVVGGRPARGFCLSRGRVGPSRRPKKKINNLWPYSLHLTDQALTELITLNLHFFIAIGAYMTDFPHNIHKFPFLISTKRSKLGNSASGSSIIFRSLSSIAIAIYQSMPFI